tara:strand:+ start:138 stop:311 length:174 start_codon:yes stop_codon:yes gene_type:complete
MTLEEAKKLSFFFMDKNIHAWPQLSNGGACVNILVEGECYQLKKNENFYAKVCINKK